MQISDFKYILTDLGGGWTTSHEFYGVTSDGDVYFTRKFSDSIFSLSTELDCDLLGHLDKIELGLKDSSEIHYTVMDASDLTVYEVGETFKVLHYAPEISDNNPKIYEDIQLLRRIEHRKATNHPVEGTSIIGEVKDKEEFKKMMEILSKGRPICSTHHAQLDRELIEKLKDSDEARKKRRKYFKNQPSLKEFLKDIQKEYKRRHEQNTSKQ